MESNAILEAVNSIIFGSHGVWFLIGAALVYFMQAGFAMCEAGFTRAKNVGNIIMKNLMDFCLGTVAFIFVGYNILWFHIFLQCKDLTVKILRCRTYPCVAIYHHITSVILSVSSSYMKT